MNIDPQVLSKLKERIAGNTLVLDPRDIEDHAHHIDHPDLHTKTINDFIAASEPEPTSEPDEITKHDVEPHGMYWHRSHVGAAPTLKAHSWFYAEVERTADEVLSISCQQFGKDGELQDAITSMAASLREYISSRTAINEMAGKRKLKQEADDGAYQLCQAAKYYLDATERAQFHIARGNSIDDNKQIERLRTLAENSMREGYAIIQAVMRASDTSVAIDFKMGSKRVVDYSCRRLTEWFAKRRENQEQQQTLSNAAATLHISSFLRGITTRKTA
jgi:hypothetical protein